MSGKTTVYKASDKNIAPKISHGALSTKSYNRNQRNEFRDIRFHFSSTNKKILLCPYRDSHAESECPYASLGSTQTLKRENDPRWSNGSYECCLAHDQSQLRPRERDGLANGHHKTYSNSKGEFDASAFANYLHARK